MEAIDPEFTQSKLNSKSLLDLKKEKPIVMRLTLTGDSSFAELLNCSNAIPMVFLDHRRDMSNSVLENRGDKVCSPKVVVKSHLWRVAVAWFPLVLVKIVCSDGEYYFRVSASYTTGTHRGF